MPEALAQPLSARQGMRTATAVTGCALPLMLLGPSGRAEMNEAAAALLDAARPEPLDRIRAAVGDIGAEGDIFAVTFTDREEAERTVEIAVLPWIRGDCRLLYLRDLTAERTLRAALADSRQRFKDLVEASSDFAWETDATGTFTMVSARGALGHAAADLVGRPAAAFVLDPPADPACLPFSARDDCDGTEIWFRHADGDPACLLVSAVPVHDDRGRWIGARGVCQDITSIRARDVELAAARNRERLMAWVLRSVGEVVEPVAMVEAATAAAARALSGMASVLLHRTGEGFRETARSGATPDPAGPPGPLVEDAVAAETVVEAPDPAGGRWIAVATRCRQRVNGALAVWRPASVEPWSEADRTFLADVASHVAIVIEQADQHRELERLSSTDGLTGLENRRAFFAALRLRLSADAGGRRDDTAPGALLYLDLDNFKQINDAGGHQRGDEVLRAVAAVLRRAAQDGDHVSRLGGDEFALWLDDTDAAGALAVAETLCAAAGELACFSPEGGQAPGFSIGAALWDPGGREDLDGLVARADAAMYRVKRAGKGRIEIAPPRGAAQ